MPTTSEPIITARATTAHLDAGDAKQLVTQRRTSGMRHPIGAHDSTRPTNAKPGPPGYYTLVSHTYPSLDEDNPAASPGVPMHPPHARGLTPKVACVPERLLIWVFHVGGG